jgi:hypothetical protein
MWPRGNRKIWNSASVKRFSSQSSLPPLPNQLSILPSHRVIAPHFLSITLGTLILYIATSVVQSLQFLIVLSSAVLLSISPHLSRDLWATEALFSFRHPRHFCSSLYFRPQLQGVSRRVAYLSFRWDFFKFFLWDDPPLWSSGQSSWLQNGDVLCFLWGTNWTYICYVQESRPPLWSSGQSSWLQNIDVMCFMWGTNSICICYVQESRPLLLPSGQSSWLQIHRSEFDSWRYQIFWEVVGLERGPLSLVNTTEQLFGRKSSGSDLESREYGHRDPSRWPRATLCPQTVGTTSPKSGGRSIGKVRSWPQAT